MINKFKTITVGVQDEPIITSIKMNKPDFVYFICSSSGDLNEAFPRFAGN